MKRAKPARSVRAETVVSEGLSAVAYPQLVKARDEEGVYLYVPVGDVRDARKKHEMPSAIVYGISGFDHRRFCASLMRFLASAGIFRFRRLP